MNATASSNAGNSSSKTSSGGVLIPPDGGSIASLQLKITTVEAEIRDVEADIKKAEGKLETGCNNEADTLYWREKEKQLRDEKKQLRKKEEQLRDELREEKQQQLSQGFRSGWLRDLTREGVESNPGPCQDGTVSAPCKCSLTKEELVQAGQQAVGGTCPDCNHKVSMHSSGAVFAPGQTAASLDPVAAVLSAAANGLGRQFTKQERKALMRDEGQAMLNELTPQKSKLAPEHVAEFVAGRVQAAKRCFPTTTARRTLLAPHGVVPDGEIQLGLGGKKPDVRLFKGVRVDASNGLPTPVLIKAFHRMGHAENEKIISDRIHKDGRCPCIVQHHLLLELDYEDTRYQCVVMDLYPLTLGDVLESAPDGLPVRLCCALLVHGLSILSAFESRGLVYGDFKPSNLALTDGQSRFVAIDLGSTRERNPKEQLMEATTQYAITLNRPITAAVDLVCLCTSVLHARTGRLIQFRSDEQLLERLRSLCSSSTTSPDSMVMPVATSTTAACRIASSPPISISSSSTTPHPRPDVVDPVATDSTLNILLWTSLLAVASESIHTSDTMTVSRAIDLVSDSGPSDALDSPVNSAAHCGSCFHAVSSAILLGAKCASKGRASAGAIDACGHLAALAFDAAEPIGLMLLTDGIVVMPPLNYFCQFNTVAAKIILTHGLIMRQRKFGRLFL